jgi:multidrug efflux pump subunit AcrA (membrane-fusion protein)
MMTANVEIVVEERRGVVLVPANAVQRRGPRSFVTVAGTPRAVEVGLADGKEIEVRSGLAADEEVTLPAGSATARAGAQRPGGMGGYQMRRMMGGGR